MLQATVIVLSVSVIFLVATCGYWKHTANKYKEIANKNYKTALEMQAQVSNIRDAVRILRETAAASPLVILDRMPDGKSDYKN